MTKKRIHPGIWFLGFVVVAILGVVGFLVWLSANETKALQIAFVPSTPIAEEPLGPAPDYSAPEAWAARPGTASRATDRPEGVEAVAGLPPVDVFFIHPTTAIPAPGDTKRWNATIDDENVLQRTGDFAMAHQASAFAPAGQIYAPRYRQAAIGAFFDTSGQGAAAMIRAYPDVVAAFDHYIANDNEGRPFIIAAHSQGSLHALMLLRDRIVGKPEQARMIAAYLIGWPISVEADLNALGMPACESATDTGCVISYQSFGVDGDPSAILTAHETMPGVLGGSRAGTQMLCSNPLSWVRGGAAPRTANLGGLPVQQGSAPLAKPVVSLTGARCGEDGVLYLTEPPQDEWRTSLLPGENYHAVDIALFYMNLRANAVERSNAFIEALRPAPAPAGGVASR